MWLEASSRGKEGYKRNDAGTSAVTEAASAVQSRTSRGFKAFIQSPIQSANEASEWGARALARGDDPLLYLDGKRQSEGRGRVQNRGRLSEQTRPNPPDLTTSSPDHFPALGRHPQHPGTPALRNAPSTRPPLRLALPHGNQRRRKDGRCVLLGPRCMPHATRWL
ncbi:unnamed protein product [Parajaminaea phylloscopi]